VRLYATTQTPDYNILILEYVSSGSLNSHLANPEKRQLLTAWTRVNILCEAATALQFLHFGDETRQKYTILHRDIKSKNICLDDNNSVKVIDYGMAKFLPAGGEFDNKQVIHSICPPMRENTTSMIVKGTSGYMCPVYLDTKEYSAPCDVYSFGVVMLEMITGCLQTINGDLTRIYKTQEKIVKCADKTAGTGWNDYLTALADLTIQCLDYEHYHRPNFRDITKDLSLIRIHMTGCVASDPDEEEDKNDDDKMHCCFCFITRAKRHGISCRDGHYMCNTCCIQRIITCCRSRKSRGNLSCPFCPWTISLDDLTHKVPIEYIMLLQNTQSRYDDMNRMGQDIQSLENRQGNLESRVHDMEGSVVTLEKDMKKINDQVLSVWKYLTKAAIEDYPCPQYIIMKPTDSDKKNIHSWFRKKITIYFVCEDSWKEIEAFDVVEPHDWVIKVAPWASMALQMLIKAGVGGLSLDVGDYLAGIVEKKFPEFNLSWTKMFAHKFSHDHLSGQPCRNEIVMKVMKDAYQVLVTEAEKPKNRGWKEKLTSVMTPDGIKWVQKEKFTSYCHDMI